MAAGTDDFVAVILGVITGTGGGVMRDVLARQRPLVPLGQIYALAAVAGAVVVVVLTHLSVAPELVAGSRSASCSRSDSLPCAGSRRSRGSRSATTDDAGPTEAAARRRSPHVTRR